MVANDADSARKDTATRRSRSLPPQRSIIAMLRSE
jgi:hypothetical protein